MIALGLSIVVSTLLFSCFRLFPQYGVRLEEAVVVNYIVAAILAISMAGPEHAWGRMDEPSTMAGVLMGLAFLYMFKKIGECTQQLGLGVVAIATKMSIVLPMTFFMVWDPADAMNWQKGLAVILAFPAVYLASDSGQASTQKEAKPLQSGIRSAAWFLPAIVFFGSGMIDLGFGWFSTPDHMTEDADRLTFAAVPFTVAALIGLLRMAFVPSAKPVWSRATVLGGIILGVINVGSLFFLLSAYQSMPFPRSAIVPVNNLGIVLATSLAGIAFFRERPNPRNLMGWALATAALVLLLLRP
jgi:uncharacterized membrane protein